MPFTLAHPAASVPFVKKGLCLSALIVGSLVPDLSKLISGGPEWNDTHYLPGLLIFDLPAGLIFLFLFHRVLKEAALCLLPEAHRARLAALAGEFNFLPLKRLGWIVGSLLVGILTHALWDYFTHEEGLFVLWTPLLRYPIPVLGHIRLPVYLLFQQLSTLAGILLLIRWYGQWFRAAAPLADPPQLFIKPSRRIQAILVMLALATAGAAFTALISAPSALNPGDIYETLRSPVIVWLGFFLAEWLLWGLIVLRFKHNAHA